jgi:hypothetical protein
MRLLVALAGLLAAALAQDSASMSLFMAHPPISCACVLSWLWSALGNAPFLLGRRKQLSRLEIGSARAVAELHM